MTTPSATPSQSQAPTMAERIRVKLEAAFAPVALQVEDQSHLHAGHAGARPGGETHFQVRLVSAAFEGQSRVARQRAVYAVLADELAERVHALALETRAPGDPERRR